MDRICMKYEIITKICKGADGVKKKEEQKEEEEEEEEEGL